MTRSEAGRLLASNHGTPAERSAAGRLMGLEGGPARARLTSHKRIVEIGRMGARAAGLSLDPEQIAKYGKRGGQLGGPARGGNFVSLDGGTSFKITGTQPSRELLHKIRCFNGEVNLLAATANMLETAAAWDESASPLLQDCTRNCAVEILVAVLVALGFSFGCILTQDGTRCWLANLLELQHVAFSCTFVHSRRAGLIIHWSQVQILAGPPSNSRT